MNADVLTGIGTAIGSVGVVAAGAWGWWLKNKKTQAETRADVAVADSQAAVYRLLTERLEALENDQRALRAELVAERAHSRRLTLHIWKLESIMRKAGLDVPIFEDDETQA